MAIDPNFKGNMKKIGEHSGHDVWGPINPPKRLGVHGSTVAVDHDSCNGDGICVEVCPVNVFDMIDTPGHPTSDKKSDPAREQDCIKCLSCEMNCPTKAILIER